MVLLMAIVLKCLKVYTSELLQIEKELIGETSISSMLPLFEGRVGTVFEPLGLLTQLGHLSLS